MLFFFFVNWNKIIQTINTSNKNNQVKWVSVLKTVERILIKIIVIQFVFMLLCQFVFHKFEIFPELHQLARYEGVSEDNFSEILETFNGR